ncbi:hypothetical protein ABZP36_034825 [Zizania latifolia]
MTDEVIKEVIIVSTPESSRSKSDDCPVNSPEYGDVSSVPSDLKRKEKPVPHYLRASTGSCHDNCKFGAHHSPESKKYWPVRRRHQHRANTGCGKQGHDEISTQRGRPRNKEMALKISLVKDGNAPAKPEFIKMKLPMEMAFDHSESSPCVQELSAEASEHVEAGTLPCDDGKCLIPDDNVACCVDRESSEGAVSIELEMPVAIQDSDASDDHVVDVFLKEAHVADVILPSEGVHKTGELLLVDDMSDGSANEYASSEKRNSQIVMASEEHEKSGNGTKSKSLYEESIKQKSKATLTTTRNIASSQKSGSTSHQKAAGTTTVESSNGQKIMRTEADTSATSKFHRGKKLSSTVPSAAPKVKEIKVPSPANAMDQSSKPARISKLKALTAKNAPSQLISSGKQTDRKMALKNVGKNAHVWQKKVEEKVILSPLKLSRSINMSAKSLLSIKTRAVKKEKPASPVKSNKKVYRAENDVADPKEKNLKTASPKVQKVEVNNKESRFHIEKSAMPRTENARGTKSATASSSILTQSPRKLTFRRGKVLNLHSNSENSTPRRLRFRPAKTVEDSNRSKESTRGRTTRKSDAATSSASKDSGSSQAEVVVLRHQDVKDRKKNEQGLFNNVIEETASKLVETRKSKVKALVGAFETVISLQESKVAPAAAVALT